MSGRMSFSGQNKKSSKLEIFEQKINCGGASALSLTDLMQVKRDFVEFGVVLALGCGVVALRGFSSAAVGEVFLVVSGSFGVVVNISRNDTWSLNIGALLVLSSEKVTEGSKIVGLNQLLSIKLGDFSLGTIIDSCGNIIFTGNRVDAEFRWLVESPAPGIVERTSVYEPLTTGILSIDAMIPIGRGQRELVLGDRQTGKTSIGIDTILNQRNEKVLSVYVACGQKASTVLEVFATFVERDSTCNLTVVLATASDPALSQYLAPYCGASVSEYYMLLCELPAFIFIDDLSKHAQSYRELSLLLRRPPGREAYPGEIFFVHSRLLERCAKMCPNLGGGSLRGFPVIETLAGDVSAYVATNVISITDGQVLLSQDLFNSGILPAIDVGLSVTRVGSSAQWDGMKLIGGKYKLELAQFAELQAFSQFASDLGEETQQKLAKGQRLIELLKQTTGSPLLLAQELCVLSFASSNLISITEINFVSRIVYLVLALPTWIYLYIPPRFASNAIFLLI